MIMGHIGFGRYFDYWIHAFHMPMFYIISGFLYKKKSTSFYEFTLKKAKSLLVPYFVFGVLHYFIYMLISIRHDTINLLEPIYHLLFINTDGLPIAGALWFLTSLFFVDLIYLVIDRQDRINKHLLVIVITLSGLFLPRLIRLPWALDTSFVGIGLYHIGHLLKEHKQSDKTLSASYGLLLVVIGTVLSSLNGYINVREGTYSNVIIFIIVSVIMTIGLYILIKNMKCFIPNKLKNELIFIGENSMVYVCLNQIVIIFVTKFLNIMLTTDAIILLLIMKLIIFMISMILLKIAVYILNNDKLKLLIGK